jgi:hypothetical protein
VNTAITDSITIVIGGTAGSLVIGQSTTISSTNNNTTYTLPMSVLVADSSGSPVKNTAVSLKLWPTRYAAFPSHWEGDTPVYGEDENGNLLLDCEDTNRNGILDGAEVDANGNGVADCEDINSNFILTEI